MRRKQVVQIVNDPNGKDVYLYLNTGEEIALKNFFDVAPQSSIDYTMNHSTIDVEIFSQKGNDYVPQYATSLSSGCDLKANLTNELIIPPNTSTVIPTGLKVNIPPGYELQIRPKSGLALKHGLTVLNSPGTVDADYSNEIGVILINHGSQPVTITPGMKIAQAVLSSVFQMKFSEVSESLIDSTDKKSERKGGFGSTGV